MKLFFSIIRKDCTFKYKKKFEKIFSKAFAKTRYLADPVFIYRETGIVPQNQVELMQPLMETSDISHDWVYISRKELRKHMGVITSHCSLGIHFRTQGIHYNDFCTDLETEEK